MSGHEWRGRESLSLARLEIPVVNLSSAGAAASLAARIKRFAGVHSAAVNPITERAVITYDPAVTDPARLVSLEIARPRKRGW